MTTTFRKKLRCLFLEFWSYVEHVVKYHVCLLRTVVASALEFTWCFIIKEAIMIRTLRFMTMVVSNELHNEPDYKIRNLTTVIVGERSCRQTISIWVKNKRLFCAMRHTIHWSSLLLVPSFCESHTMGIMKTTTMIGPQLGKAAMVESSQLGNAACADSAMGPNVPHTIVWKNVAIIRAWW